MSSKSVSIDELAQAISDVFDEYEQLSQRQVREAILRTGKKLAQDINARAKTTFGGTGKYARSWRSKEDTTQSTRLNTVAVVYANENGYRLAHLLEKGHALRNGGRVAGRPHIEPATEAARDTLIEEIKKELG